MKKKTSKQEMKVMHKFKCNIFGKFKKKERMYGNGTGSAVYCLGFIGALIYYTTTAPSFWVGVLGFFKALVWPAFLVYEMLKFLAI